MLKTRLRKLETSLINVENSVETVDISTISDVDFSKRFQQNNDRGNLYFGTDIKITVCIFCVSIFFSDKFYYYFCDESIELFNMDYLLGQ